MVDSHYQSKIRLLIRCGYGFRKIKGAVEIYPKRHMAQFSYPIGETCPESFAMISMQNGSITEMTDGNEKKKRQYNLMLDSLGISPLTGKLNNIQWEIYRASFEKRMRKKAQMRR